MSQSGPDGPTPLPSMVLETLRHLRFQMQRHHDTVERLAEDLNRQATASARDLAALLECLLADRLAPAVQDLTAIEEDHASPGGGRGS
jgi:predicted transcriptional regulator